MRRVLPYGSAPTEPVTLIELKAHLRITDAAEDAYLTALISTARIMVEMLTRRTIPSTTLKLFLDFWPHESQPWFDGVREGPVYGERRESVEIPRPPLISVQSIKTYAQDDTAATMAADLYRVSNNDPDQCGRVVLRNTSTWPAALRYTDAVEIAFTAGYSTIPGPLKQAIMMMAGHMYGNRGECEAGGCASACGASHLIEAYRIERVVL